QEHGSAVKLQFLHKHFLLASLNKQGQLHYQDVTTGVMVGNYRTGLGRGALQLNRFNDVAAVGHSGGVVTMWKPTAETPLVKMLCHRGPVKALAFHPNGHLMATSGMERKIKLWDLRKFEVLQTLPGQVEAMDFSQRGLLATASGSSVRVLSSSDSSGSHENYGRYMSHAVPRGYQVKSILFRPYFDSLGIGHSQGLSSILIPGSGEPNFDTMVANPYETRKQRNEKEIHSLLDKLPPETIMLDPTKIGTLSRGGGAAATKTTGSDKEKARDREAEKEMAVESAKNLPVKKKTKGRNKGGKVAKKKREAVENAKKPFMVMEKKRKRNNGEESFVVNKLPKSLQRFAPPRKST
ncbi:hypothetical protein M569_16879, partial [Genlisea aurea]